MPSLISGYEYDIFISYRQKDNKYDGWVTAFVSNLKRELEATFKDEVSVYFDSNPGDALLETYNVDKSLEGKLKCLILIPILSQTYCDPKSFAWQHEFCAFNKLAGSDSFGRDIRLANGNVASRILPVKIHDLDAEDTELIERETGGVLRFIDFIFKSVGVNRPLKPEDQRAENDHRIFYRDQINKVANAVKEIILAMEKKTPSTPLTTMKRADKVTLKGKRTLAIIGGAVMLASILTFLLFNFFVARNDENMDKSIAVLPFMDMSQEHDQEYFADGMMEEILNHLAKIGDLRVISRTSSMKYKGTKLSISEIAKELGVTNILEGSIRKSGEKIRITVQLIEVTSEKHLWSEDYDFRDLKDIFSVQSEVSRRVAETLKIRLTSSEKESLAKKNTENPEAYNFYLKGRFFWAQRTNQSYDSAELNYKKAIQLDPEYALAYSGLADCYTLGQQGMTSVEETPIATAYLKKALSIDSTLCEALTTMGFIQSHMDYDWEKGKKTLEKAIRINPNYSIAHLYYGNTFIFTGDDIEKGLSEVRTALDLDPLSSSVNWALGNRYFLSNKPDLAVKQFQKTLVLDPNYGPATTWLALSYLRKGMSAEAIGLLSKLPEKLPMRNIGLGLAQIESGDKDQAKKDVDKILEGGMLTTDIGPIVIFASLQVKLNNYDAALTLLEQAYAIRSLNLMGLKIDHYWDPIRDQPRFKALLKKMNFD